jgi:transposase
VLFDVSTLYFETDAGDGFREPGFSKERRLDPQITLGLLTDAAGFPLTVAAFKGNQAETATMLPVINAFKAAHQLSEVTVVADAGMILGSQPDRPASGRPIVRPGHPHPVSARRGARMA